jgi:hypothetical protein
LRSFRARSTALGGAVPDQAGDAVERLELRAIEPDEGVRAEECCRQQSGGLGLADPGGTREEQRLAAAGLGNGVEFATDDGFEETIQDFGLSPDAAGKFLAQASETISEGGCGFV